MRRTLLYVFMVGGFLVLMSATAPSASAQPDSSWMMIENFENISDWSGDITRENDYKEEGTYSGKLYNDGVTDDTYANKTAAVDLTYINNLRFWYRVRNHWAVSGTVTATLGIATDNVFTTAIEVESIVVSSGTTVSGVKEPDVSGYTGDYYVRFHLNTTTNEAGSFWFDNLQQYAPPPYITSLTYDNSLIDRDANYSGSNAVTATEFQADVEYETGNAVSYEDVYFVLYDNESTMVENAQADASYTQVSDNVRRFAHTYDATDNTLTDSQLGTWRIRAEVENNATENTFVVDDLAMTINLSPDNAYIGYACGRNLTASGDITRVSGISISTDNSWLYDENAGQIVLGASDSYSESYTITAAPGADNIYVRVRAIDAALDGENFNYYDVNENSLYEVRVYWESAYTLVPDGDNENAIENRNYRLTFFFEDRTQEFDMATNPENFIIQSATPQKLRLDVTDDNYWRTRVLGLPGTVDVIIVENIGGLDQYEFLLKDLTGAFGPADNGQIWFSRYVGTDFLHVHEDYWDAEESATVFLIFGQEYSLKLVAPTQERAVGWITADAITTKEISVGVFMISEYAMIWDDVAWSLWWSADNDLKVSYLDNTGETDNVTANIYDENDDLAYTVLFTTNQWTLTWLSADEDTDYVVELIITHQTFGSSTTKDILLSSWESPAEEEGALPGVGQLGSLPFTWGAGIGIIIVLAVALTFGARHAGFCVLTIGMFLVVLGPIMGFFRLHSDPAVEWGFISFIIMMGVLMMLVKRGG